MDNYQKYILSTFLYGLCFVIGVIAALFFIYERSFFLAFLGVLFAYVSLDNFFCGSRAKTCGFAVKEHYIAPWNLKKSKTESKVYNKI
jgi:hypothetical protein